MLGLGLALAAGRVRHRNVPHHLLLLLLSPQQQQQHLQAPRTRGYSSRSDKIDAGASDRTPNHRVQVPLGLPSVCIWGANTGVGKTLISAGLVAAAVRNKVSTSGLDPRSIPFAGIYAEVIGLGNHSNRLSMRNACHSSALGVWAPV
jgi:hypothetical protein